MLCLSYFYLHWIVLTYLFFYFFKERKGFKYSINNNTETIYYYHLVKLLKIHEMLISKKTSVYKQLIKNLFSILIFIKREQKKNIHIQFYITTVSLIRYFVYNIFIYLTHSSGYVTQSVIHLYLCHASHPIGGVKANPLSRQVTPWSKTANAATVTAIEFSIVSGCCKINTVGT